MLKIVLLLAYFALMVCIGLYCRKTATDVNGFVLVALLDRGLPPSHMELPIFLRWYL